MCSLMCEKVKQDRFSTITHLFSFSFHFFMSESNIIHKQKYSLSCSSWYKNSRVTDFHLGFLRHRSFPCLPVCSLIWSDHVFMKDFAVSVLI